MDKNAFIAIALCLAILLGWNYLLPPAPPETKKIERLAEEALSEKTIPQENKQVEKKSQAESDEFVKYEDKLVTIDNEYVKAQIGSRSGGIYSWELKKYKDQDGNPIQLAKNHELSPLNLSLGHFFTGKSLRDKTFYPFKLVSSSENELKFEFEDENIKLIKVYRFVPDAYEIKIYFEVESKKNDLTGYLACVLADKYKPVKGGFLSYQGAPQRFLYS